MIPLPFFRPHSLSESWSWELEIDQTETPPEKATYCTHKAVRCHFSEKITAFIFTKHVPYE